VRKPHIGAAARIRPDGQRESSEGADIITFSHLRWDFVFQRPQHLMSRFSRGGRRVFFFEEPIIGEAEPASLEIRLCPKTGVFVLTPHYSSHLSRFAAEETLKLMLDGALAEQRIARPTLWYYTPTMYPFSRHIDACAVVYDCMDELANFRFAPAHLPLYERDLIRDADVVFTGGYSLYEAKRSLHPNIYAFPSSVERAHFAAARSPNLTQPQDQAEIPHPRLGFYGVIDERMDFALIAAIADARPDWSIIMVGPVAKVGQDELPMRPNIHYLGGKSYDELPRYLAGWDVALMPFAINEATRFISPTKTLEYLAGGKPIVSTPITDVVRQFGQLECVRIAQTPAAFVAAAEAALGMQAGDKGWLRQADAVLAKLSWDRTFSRMNLLLKQAVRRRGGKSHSSAPIYHREAFKPEIERRTEP